MENETKLKESIASLLKDKTKREALAEMLVEYVQPNHVTTDFVGMLLNTRSLKPGDSLVKKIRKGINVHTLVPGSIHLANELTVSDRMNYILDGADVKVTLNQWELENGELGTVDSIKSEMLAKLKDYYQNKVFTALTTIWTPANTPSNFTAVGGNITALALKNAINQINNTVGKVRAIVGVRSALMPITEFAAWQSTPIPGLVNGWSDPILTDIIRTGMVGQYYGAPIVALDQIYDAPDTYASLLPTDKILVIGENVGEFITFGDVKGKQYEDNRPTPPQLFIELWQQFGMIIDNASGIYVLQVS